LASITLNIQKTESDLNQNNVGVIVWITVQSVYSFIPVIGIITSNTVLVVALKIKRKVGISDARRHISSMLYETRTTVLLSVITTIFVVCVTPNDICLTFQDVYPALKNMLTTLPWRITLILFHMTHNIAYVVAFYIGSSRFRNFVKNNLFR